MWISVALVTITYVIPVAAVSHSGLDPNSWTTGGWVDAGRAVGGPLARRCAHHRRNYRRRRHIQRADDVLLAVAPGDGRNRRTAKNFLAHHAASAEHLMLRSSSAHAAGPRVHSSASSASSFSTCWSPASASCWNFGRSSGCAFVNQISRGPTAFPAECLAQSQSESRHSRSCSPPDSAITASASAT